MKRCSNANGAQPLQSRGMRRNRDSGVNLAEQAPALKLRRELRLTDLVLFNVVATLGPQLVPAFAHVGRNLPKETCAKGMRMGVQRRVT